MAIANAGFQVAAECARKIGDVECARRMATAAAEHAANANSALREAINDAAKETYQAAAAGVAADGLGPDAQTSAAAKATIGALLSAARCAIRLAVQESDYATWDADDADDLLLFARLDAAEDAAEHPSPLAEEKAATRIRKIQAIERGEL